MQISNRLRNAVLWISVFLSPASCILAQGEREPKVSLGAVTKYTGSISSAELQRSQDFLATLETQIAARFIQSPDVAYLDRGNLDEVFREANLSSGASFDSSSGALRGLLGRLDYMLIAESSSPTMARVRVLDIETGAVKVAAICQAHTSLFGGTAEPECISSIVAQMSSQAKSQLSVKRQRLLSAASAAKAAEERRIAQQIAITQAAKDEERRRMREERIEAQKQQQMLQQQQIENNRRADEQRASEQQQIQILQQIGSMRSRYEDSMSQLSAASDFWEHLRQQLRDQGHSLRPEVQSALASARSNGSRCSEALAARNPDGLNACLDDLTRNLDHLEQYK